MIFLYFWENKSGWMKMKMPLIGQFHRNVYIGRACFERFFFALWTVFQSISNITAPFMINGQTA